jgi:hypothetical protein
VRRDLVHFNIIEHVGFGLVHEFGEAKPHKFKQAD